MDAKIEKFISSEENRHKNNCSSLGDLLSMTLVSKKYNFKDIVTSYIEE